MWNKVSLGFALACVINNYSNATVSNGIYTGIELGAANQIINYQASAFGENTNGVQLINSNVTFMGRFNLGYNADKNNGFELGTNYFFNSNSSTPNGNDNLSTNTTALDLSYIGYLPISQSKLSVFGRVGIAYDWINSSTSNSCNCNNNQSSFQPSGSNFADVLGAGLKYNLSSHASIRLEWIANGLLVPVSINNGSQNIASWTAQTFVTGINYHF